MHIDPSHKNCPQLRTFFGPAIVFLCYSFPPLTIRMVLMRLRTVFAPCAHTEPRLQGRGFLVG